MHRGRISCRRHTPHLSFRDPGCILECCSGVGPAIERLVGMSLWQSWWEMNKTEAGEEGSVSRERWAGQTGGTAWWTQRVTGPGSGKVACPRGFVCRSPLAVRPRPSDDGWEATGLPVAEEGGQRTFYDSLSVRTWNSFAFEPKEAPIWLCPCCAEQEPGAQRARWHGQARVCRARSAGSLAALSFSLQSDQGAQVALRVRNAPEDSDPHCPPLWPVPLPPPCIWS